MSSQIVVVSIFSWIVSFPNITTLQQHLSEQYMYIYVPWFLHLFMNCFILKLHNHSITHLFDQHMYIYFPCFSHTMHDCNSSAVSCTSHLRNVTRIMDNKEFLETSRDEGDLEFLCFSIPKICWTIWHQLRSKEAT